MATVRGPNPGIIQFLTDSADRENPTPPWTVTFQVDVGFNFFGSDNAAQIEVAGRYIKEPVIDMQGSRCNLKVLGEPVGDSVLYLAVHCGGSDGLTALVSIDYGID